MKQWIAATASVVGLASCSDLPASPYPAETSVVFEGDRALELADQCSRREPGPVEGTWTPTKKDILRLEADLPGLFEERLAARWPDDDLQALDYYRQYGGLVIEGRRIVYVAGFHRQIRDDLQGREDGRGFYPTPDAWRDGAISVCDGGPIVFGVEYDPEAGTFANFAFNGAI